MIVASFFAPRPEHPKWRDYLPSLRLLQTSCDRLGLRHVVIGDAPLPGFEVFSADLPRDLMPAFVLGQALAIDALDDDLLLVGADCVIARDPRAVLRDCDVAVTLGDFWDCQLNTGAIWIARAVRRRAAKMWLSAFADMGLKWGDDQLAIAAQFEPLADLRLLPVTEERQGLRVKFLPVDPWNLAPSDPLDDCSHAAILHFRGNRKAWSPAWCQRFLGFGGDACAM